MPWGYVAAAGISYLGATEAAKTSAKASGERTDVEIEKMERWEEIYGPIEQNLADYYTQLTPEVLTAAGLEAEAESFAKAQTQITTKLAQRNISGGGLEADLLAKGEIQHAESRATIRKEAKEDVRTQQEQFLRGGKPDKTRTEQRIAALSDQAASEAAASERSAYQSVAQIVGAGAKKYAASQQPDVAASPVDNSVYHNNEYDAYDN